MSRLRIKNLEVRYDGRPVLKGIDATIEPGEIVGLIGPNGAGKTTLLRACVDLLSLHSGAICLGDRRLDRIPRKELARAIAYIASGAPCHWPLEVERLVALGRRPHLSPWTSAGTADQAAIVAAMELTDVTQFRGRATTELSDGERARVMLARALAGQPQVLLADEPVSGLDPHHQLTVMTVLVGQARIGGSVIVTLHDLGLAARFCDRLLVLDRGMIVADGLPRDVLSAQILADVFGIRAVHGETDGAPYLVPWAAIAKERGDDG